jgi:hypothetical protein
MNEYTVTWKPLAEDQLADAWLAAYDNRAVTDAQAAVDRLLRANPFGHGRYLSEGLFEIRVRPLSVFFTADEEKKQVWVEELRMDAWLKQTHQEIYWIVNHVVGQVEVYTDLKGGRDAHYRQRQDYTFDESVPVVINGEKVGSVRVRDLVP